MCRGGTLYVFRVGSLSFHYYAFKMIKSAAGTCPDLDLTLMWYTHLLWYTHTVITGEVSVGYFYKKLRT